MSGDLVPTSPEPASTAGRAWRPAPSRRVVGWLLLLPVALVVAVQGIWPAIRGIGLSLRDGGLLDDGEPVGLDNYSRLLDDPGIGGMWRDSVVIGVLPLLAAVVTAIVLGIAGGNGIRSSRLVNRALIAAPIAVFAPVGTTVAVLGSGAGPADPSDPALVTSWASSVVFGAVVGIVTGVVGTLVIACLRGRDGSIGSRVLAVATVGGVGALGAVALGLQAFAVPYLLPGRGHEFTTVSVRVLTEMLTGVSLGSSAALGSLLFLVVAGLGVGAVVLLLGVRARVDPERRPERPVSRASRGQVAWAVGGTLVIVACLVAHARGNGAWYAAMVEGGRGSGSQALTWVPSLVGAVLQVGLACLGGYAIGWCRPLGARSEWLLVFFAPGLFLTTVPFTAASYLIATDLGVSNTYGALLRSPVVSVPGLVVFTLVFAGIRRRGESGSRDRVAAGVLAVGGLLLVTTWVIDAQELLRPLLMWNRSPVPSVSAVVRDPAGIGTVPTTPIVLLVVLAVVVVLCAVGVDRWGIHVGAGRRAPGTGVEEGDPPDERRGAAALMDGRTGAVSSAVDDGGDRTGAEGAVATTTNEGGEDDRRHRWRQYRDSNQRQHPRRGEAGATVGRCHPGGRLPPL